MSTINGIVDFVAKQGEQLVLSATLFGADGTVANLTGAAVVLSMRQRQAGTALTLGGATAVVAAAAGTIKYTGVVADTAQPGEMEAEFTVDFGAGRIQKFPDGKGEYLLGYITPKIA